jgi:ubiquinone/menaquinone biosynthesis C-methylase UbiE
MPNEQDIKSRLFDQWPERYDSWFETPIGALVKRYESELLMDMLKPCRGETILDVGCGTGVFTRDILSFGTRVTGIDISQPMLKRARQKAGAYSFREIVGDMRSLPFADNCFDKVISVTALEFIEDGKGVVRDIFRVTKKGGIIVVATLNSLSPWAVRRKHETEKGHSIFKRAIFRAPDELRTMAPASAVVKTTIHFQKNDDPKKAPEIERDGRKKGLVTGAFLAAKWEKP